jgi:hypothetical protein
MGGFSGHIHKVTSIAQSFSSRWLIESSLSESIESLILEFREGIISVYFSVACAESRVFKIYESVIFMIARLPACLIRWMKETLLYNFVFFHFREHA